MSLHYEVVFACFLRDDTPDTVLDALRWHMGEISDRPAGMDASEHPCPMLIPDPDSYLPGGDTASLRHQSRGNWNAWGLFTRSYWLDDEIGEVVPLLDLLAPHVEDPGYGGHLREEAEAQPAIVTFGGGTYVLETD
ncbi:hypothetical protein [Streptomyces sp. NRRL B-1347]|uniref:hypothetical protein n=1 Tax=Streptomyces sp. NRRL B-1347 TaxID=1476877 RepID=UPI0004CBDE90|nr:hypothetical protein [Streptomyces sp. NRRL B-1347]